jgi:hypothetical protein
VVTGQLAKDISTHANIRASELSAWRAALVGAVLAVSAFVIAAVDGNIPVRGIIVAGAVLYIASTVASTFAVRTLSNARRD